MWATSTGDRTLVGPEARLVKAVVGYLRDMITVGVEIDEAYQADVELFNELQPTQQLAALHEVAFALLDPSTPILELTAIRESTVYLIFRELRTLIEIEIEMSQSGSTVTEIRGLILQSLAASNVESQFFQDFLQNHADPATGSEPPDRAVSLPTAELAPEQASTTSVANGFPPDSTDMETWLALVDELIDDVLWDRDFEMSSLFLDADPGRAEELKQTLGINDAYFAVPAPDVAEARHVELDRELLELTRDDNPVWGEVS